MIIRSIPGVIGLLGLAALTADAAAVQLYSFGPNANSFPINFTQFDTSGAGSVHSLGNLGTGSRFFNGGLVAQGGAFYAIGNDATIDQSVGDALVSFANPMGGGTALVSLDPNIGWTGGLTFDPLTNLFYTIGFTSGIPTLYSIDTIAHTVSPLFAVGDGTLGFSGLAFDSGDGLFYAVANGAFDGQSNPTDQLMVLDIHNLALASLVFQFGGTGYLGGLAFDATNGRFYTIQSQSSAEAVLVQLGLANGGSATTLYDMGVQGLQNAGIAAAPAAQGVPEPSTGILFAAALLAFAAGSALRRGFR